MTISSSIFSAVHERSITGTPFFRHRLAKGNTILGVEHNKAAAARTDQLATERAVGDSARKYFPRDVASFVPVLRAAAAAAAGMVTLREDGASKVLAGETTIEEVMRVTQEDLL